MSAITCPNSHTDVRRVKDSPDCQLLVATRVAAVSGPVSLVAVVLAAGGARQIIDEAVPTARAADMPNRADQLQALRP